MVELVELMELIELVELVELVEVLSPNEDEELFKLLDTEEKEAAAAEGRCVLLLENRSGLADAEDSSSANRTVLFS